MCYIEKGNLIQKGGDFMARGGARKGAGRKGSGYTKKTVTVSLPESDWAYIELLRQEKEMSMSEYFRTVVDRTLTDDLRSLNTTDLDPDDLLIL